MGGGRSNSITQHTLKKTTHLHHDSPYSAAPSKQRACVGQPALPQCRRPRPHASERSARMTASNSALGRFCLVVVVRVVCWLRERERERDIVCVRRQHKANRQKNKITLVAALT